MSSQKEKSDSHSRRVVAVGLDAILRGGFIGLISGLTSGAILQKYCKHVCNL